MLELITTHWVKIYAGASMAFYLLVWAMKKTYASKENLDQLRTRMTNIETKVDQLPNKEKVHKLELHLSEVNGKLDGVSQQLEKINRTTEMLLENELQGEKR